MPTNASERTAEAVVTQFLAGHSFDETYSLVDENVVVEDWANPGGQIVGRDRVFAEVFSPAHEAFEETSYSIADIVSNADMVAIRAVFTGRFERPYLGFAPTHTQVAWSFHDFYKVADGRIVRMWFGSDTAAIARALSTA